MFKTRTMLVLMLMLLLFIVSKAENAAADSVFPGVSGSVLLKQCQSKPEGQRDEFCLGFTIAAIESFQLAKYQMAAAYIEAGLAPQQKVVSLAAIMPPAPCVPAGAGATNNQDMDNVIAYLIAHPESRDRDPAAWLVQKALAETWPCSGKSLSAYLKTPP